MTEHTPSALPARQSAIEPWTADASATVISTAGMSLDDLARAANTEHGEVMRIASSAVAHAVACGRLLIAARPLVPTGSWFRWLEANLEFTGSVAMKYVRLATYADSIPATTTTIYGALDHLRSIGTPVAKSRGNSRRDPLTADEWAMAREMRQGKHTYRQIAAAFGVSPALIAVNLDPAAAKRYRDSKNRANARRSVERAAAKRAQRDAGMRRVGGTPSHAYSMLRKLAVIVDRAITEAADAETAELLRRALAYAHKAEDEIVFAMRVERRTERQPLSNRIGGVALQGRAPGGRRDSRAVD